MESVSCVPKCTSAATVVLQLCPRAPVHTFIVRGSTSKRGIVAGQFPPRHCVEECRVSIPHHMPTVVPPQFHMGSKSVWNWKIPENFMERLGDSLSFGFWATFQPWAQIQITPGALSCALKLYIRVVSGNGYISPSSKQHWGNRGRLSRSIQQVLLWRRMTLKPSRPGSGSTIWGSSGNPHYRLPSDSLEGTGRKFFKKWSSPQSWTTDIITYKTNETIVIEETPKY